MSETFYEKFDKLANIKAQLQHGSQRSFNEAKLAEVNDAIRVLAQTSEVTSSSNLTQSTSLARNSHSTFQQTTPTSSEAANNSLTKALTNQ